MMTMFLHVTRMFTRMFLPVIISRTEHELDDT